MDMMNSATKSFVDSPRKTYYSMSLLLLAIGMATFRVMTRPKTNAPSLHPPGFFEFFAVRRRVQAIHGSRSLLEDSYKSFPGKSFRIMTNFAEMIILPYKSANEIRNDERFSFFGFTRRTLNEETAFAMSEILTEEQDWHTITLKKVALELIARISSRVFLGEELCRNEEWLKVTREYAVTIFQAVNEMLVWPSLVRGIVSRFSPTSRRAASLIKDARMCMEPVLEKRQQERASGTYVPYNDAIEWFEAAAKSDKEDLVLAQLGLSTAAIFGTMDSLSQTVGHLAVHHDFIEPLRKEVIECLVEGGWNKTTLQNMKLLDSCIKESLRMKPMFMFSMGRRVREDVTLSDGTFLPKGSLVAVSSQGMHDPAVYANPYQWDGARFFNMGHQPGQEQTSQLVATGPNHLAFGHGHHACPGRFFAANEIKIALAHLLLKYDFRLHDREPRVKTHGLSQNTDPDFKLDVRRRREEIDLGAL
ncbi:hypothetical protein E4U43_000556 [Claviceps pusilla]|uniref:Uncharacterized protein n=1 Tax=Claviceps pusilla TaxID=123648 RepID=A0A9P7NBS5_9HYPO|nr:hypothetical protein E4U43_000556 [Claviceps pusilla]